MSCGWEWMMGMGLMRYRRCKEPHYLRQLFPSYFVGSYIQFSPVLWDEWTKNSGTYPTVSRV